WLRARSAFSWCSPLLCSIAREHEGDAREDQGDGDEDRSQPQAELHGTARQRSFACPIRTRLPRSLVTRVEAVTEDGDGERNEVGLVRRQSSQVADPRATYANTDEPQRQHAARRGGNRTQHACDRRQSLRGARRDVLAYRVRRRFELNGHGQGSRSRIAYSP